MGCNKNSSKRKVHSNTILHQETRKTVNRQPNFTPKTTGEISTKITKVRRRKEMIKIRAEINGKERKEISININKTKSCFFEKISKNDKLLARLIKIKWRRIKSAKLKMKKERLHQTMQKYKRL